MAHNMELTKAQKEKLFKLLPMSTTYQHKFTPEEWGGLPKEITPIFTITQLTTELMEIIKRMAVDAQVRGNRQLKATALLKEGNERIATMYTVLEGCVSGWENLNVVINDKGEDESFEILPYAKENVSKLPTKTMASVFQEILVISGMGEEEEEKKDKSETSE